MSIRSWSTVAADNNSAPPNGFPEGQTPGSLNNSCRQLMADVRDSFENLPWFDYGNTPTRTGNTTFTVATDLTARYAVGRRLKLVGATTGYGTISASSYSAPDTTVTVTMDSGNVPLTLSTVSVGPDSNAAYSQDAIGRILYPRTAAETSAGVTPSDYEYPPDASKGYSTLRVDADASGATACDTAISNAIAVAKIMGIANGSAGRDQGVDIYLPAGLYTVDNPIVLPRSGNTRSYCVGIIGDGESTRITPSASFPAGRAVIEWEAATSRVFHQRLKHFKIDMRTGLAHKAIHFELNDPTTTVFNSQPWGQEEIKELDLDVMIHGDNTSHEVLVDIEGKVKFSKIRISADLAQGTSQTYSSIVFRANSEFIGSDGLPGDKADAVAGDNAGINYSELYVEAVNSRGGNARCFVGRLSACNVLNMTTATGGYGSESILELYGSANNVFFRSFMEGRTENPQIYMEQCYYNTFLNVHFGSPDGSPSTGIEMVECEDNIFFNHSSASNKPAFSSNGGYLVDLDADCKRNRFIGFGAAASFFAEINDLGTDNYFEYVREDTGALTQNHKRADYSIGPWTQDNAAASQTDVELTGTRWIAPRAGRVTAVTVKSTEARTASTLTIKVFKNTTGLYGGAGSEISSSLRSQLNGTETSYETTLAENEYTFNAGDEIYPVVLTGGTWAPTTADIRVWIEVQC